LPTKPIEIGGVIKAKRGRSNLKTEMSDDDPSTLIDKPRRMILKVKLVRFSKLIVKEKAIE